MTKAPCINLVDIDQRRRKVIVNQLLFLGCDVREYECVEDLIESFPSDGILFIEDRSLALKEIMYSMVELEICLPIISYSEEINPRRILSISDMGVVDYIRYPFSPEEIVEIINNSDAEIYLKAFKKLCEFKAARQVSCLTKREKQILVDISNGLSSKLIAEKYEISRRTVDIHRANLLKKMGDVQTTVAVRYAVESSLHHMM